MKKPEINSSENKASPGKDGKKKAVSGAAIDSRPVSSGEGASAAAVESKPPVESVLVGKGGSLAAAAPKPDAGKTAAESKPAAPKPAEAPSPTTFEPVPAKSTAPSGPAKVETRVVEVRKGGFVPTFVGGVVAAGLGAAAAWWAIPHLPPAWQPGASESAPTEAQIAAAREAGIEAARAEIQTQAEAFATRAADAGADAARQALADAPQQQGGDAEALSALEQKLAVLEKSLADLNARPVVAPVVSGENSDELQQLLNELTAKLTAQQQRIDELASRGAGGGATAEQMQSFAAQAEALRNQIAATAEEAERRIAAAEAQAADLQSNAEAANRRAQAATAAAALRAAIETGGQRDQALAGLRAAGVEPPAVLTGDVPTLEQLRANFPAAAREGLAAALQEVQGSNGALGMIGDFLRVQTGARSVEPREGNDPDAILSRADAAVKAGDIKGALEEIASLPQSGQQAMADWTASAGLWIEANAALAALAAGSM